MLAEATLNSSNDEEEYCDDNQHGKNGASPKPSTAESPTQNRSHYLKPFSVYLNRLEVPEVVDKIDELSEPLICGSKLPFSVFVNRIFCAVLLIKIIKISFLGGKYCLSRCSYGKFIDGSDIFNGFPGQSSLFKGE